MITNKELVRAWIYELLAIVERTSDDYIEADRSYKSGNTTIITVKILQK